MKIEEIIHQLNRRVRYVLAITGPPNALTLANAPALVGMVKRLTRSSQLEFPRSQRGTTLVSTPGIEIIIDTLRVSHIMGIMTPVYLARSISRSPKENWPSNSEKD